MIKSSSAKRKIPSKQNQFQFVATNIKNVDNGSVENCKLNEIDIKQETGDDSVFDVFADFIDSKISSDEDEGDKDSDNYLFVKRPKLLCEMCNKIFKNKSDYNIHINWMHKNQKENVFLCTRCPTKFSCLPEIVKHIKEHKAQTKRIIMCDICGIQKKNIAYMDDHIRVHLKELAFNCDVCTASFNTKHGLKRHLRRHAGLKKYKCDECGTAYFDSSDYKRHLVKHGVIEKECFCSICGNGFYERKLLKYHIIKVHNICNGEELKFLPEPRNVSQSRFRFLKKPLPKVNVKKPPQTSKPKPAKKQTKSPKLSATAKRKNLKLIDLEVTNENNDQESVECLSSNKVLETKIVKEEIHMEDDKFLSDDETNIFINDNVETSFEISDNKTSFFVDVASLNEFKSIPEFTSECVSVESDILRNPEEKQFIDIISKLNETENTVRLLLNNVQESLQLIESFKYNKEKVEIIHQKTGMIQKKIQQIIHKMSKQENDSMVQFLPLNDIGLLDQKLNDTTFNSAFVKYFESCYPEGNPHNLEDIEQILSDSFLKQYSIRRIGNRKFIDHKCLMHTLHKIWRKHCRTYKEFNLLMRSQIWKITLSFIRKQKAQQ